MVLRRAYGTWVITGAAGGLGREFARQLRLRDEAVALWDRDAEGLERLRRELPGQRIGHMVVDLRDPEAVLAAAARVRAEIGPVAHLIHTAGVLAVGAVGEGGPLHHREVFETNVLGTVHAIAAVLPQLEEAARNQRRGATALLFSSIAGLKGFPETSAYCASMFAVRGFAESLREEVAETNVDVRVVVSAGVDTPMLRALERLPPVYARSPLLEAKQVVAEALGALESHERFLVSIGAKRGPVGRLEQRLRRLRARRRVSAPTRSGPSRA